MARVWPSSTLTTPSLPTFSIASAISEPVFARTLFRLLRAEVLDDLFDSLLDAAAQRQRVGPGGDVLEALANDHLGQQGRRRGAVTGDVVGRRSDLADELGALVLEDVLYLDLAGDGDAV